MIIFVNTFQSLQLSQRALANTAPGKLVNLLSNDVSRFDIISVVIHPLWASPLMTIIAAYILWIEIRWAGIIGIAIVFLIVPIQSNCLVFFCTNHHKIPNNFNNFTMLNRLCGQIVGCNSIQDCTANGRTREIYGRNYFGCASD